MKNKIIIGSRESKLAVIQSRIVQKYIQDNNPGTEAELLTMKTTGDIILDKTLDKVGGKGLFVKELDKALLEKRSDISVHSLKDMPMQVPKELPIIAFSKREDARDVLVLPKEQAEKGITQPDLSKPIGSSGPRRQLQLQKIFPGCTVKSVRGNVLTRLEKLDNGEYGALVLAAAGLKRLGLEHRITRYFEPQEMMPAAGQGILAVQGRAGEDYSFLDGFEDKDSALCARAERAFVSALDGGCSSPIAAYGRVKDGEMKLMGLYYSEQNKNWDKMEIKGAAEQPEELGKELADRLKNAVDNTCGKGKVWLVGAGPGDAGLFTLKGKAVLEKADVVVYDALVGPGVLSLIPENAEKINVGKRASHHIMRQEDINRLLADKALKGNNVVRLKGGDPFLFGRGGEELELLSELGIECEVVPGVTAAISVPAYNGIPVTHRDFCSSVHIITGHKREGEEYNIDFDALVRTKGTLVFLMGVTALKDICAGLINAGMRSDMPAAILQQGTTAGQKKIVATVSTLADEVQKQGIETPAIIVVGRVCSLADRFAWYEKLPLFGCRILVTRPKNRPSVMAQKLQTLGAEVLELPSVKTVAKPDRSQLKAALKNISEYKWLVFTSPYGVEVFFDELRNLKTDVRKLGDIKIAAIGPSTAMALEERGLTVDLIPQVYSGEVLGKELAELCGKVDKILLARAEIGSAELTAQLAQQTVSDVPIYTTEFVSQDIVDVKKLADEGKLSCVTFTSASTVAGFAEYAKGVDMTSIKAACIGQQTAKAAKALGMQTYTAEKATMDSLTKLIEKLKTDGTI